MGDLSGVLVYKFKMVKQLTLLAYTCHDQTITLTFLAFGTHENFYRDPKNGADKDEWTGCPSPARRTTPPPPGKPWVSKACRQISDRSGSDRSTANKLAKSRKMHYPSYLTIK